MANTIKSNRESVFWQERIYIMRLSQKIRKVKCPPWTIQATKMKHDN